jgi:hypothetical protein
MISFLHNKMCVPPTTIEKNNMKLEGLDKPWNTNDNLPTYWAYLEELFKNLTDKCINISKEDVGTLPNGYTKSSPSPMVNPKVRINHRPEYRAQLALQAHTATQYQLLRRTLQLTNSIAMVSPWRII